MEALPHPERVKLGAYPRRSTPGGYVQADGLRREP